MELTESLADSGKSRADLWSFASAVAVEWGLDRNNKAGMNNEHGNVDLDRFICPLEVFWLMVVI